ncbi:NADPH-dependent F420 reductase [Streptomyces sp. NPDC004685]
MAHVRIGVVGGTGPQGKGLAFRLAQAGHEVILGSRVAERAVQAAAELTDQLEGSTPLVGLGNRDAADASEVIILAVPYDGHDALVAELADGLDRKIVISCVNPLGFDKGGPFGLSVSAGSAAEEVAKIVPTARVVGAFHHLAAPLLLDPAADLSHEDVLVCGDDVEAKAVVVQLAADVTGGRGIDAGKLRLAAQLEPLTAVLISVNKRYKTRSGIALTGLAADHMGNCS